MVIRVDMDYASWIMRTYAKLGIGAWLAPGLTALLIGVAVWVAVPAFFAGAALGVGLLAFLLLRGGLGALRRWTRNRFSPVRRRGPRPPAWHQWR
jgi:hypothetical protein